MAQEKRSHDDYSVGWICALPMEQTAATAMLDERHSNLPNLMNDTNTYTLGSIGPHNVVIACLPKGYKGNSPATNVATLMVRSFPSIKIGLLVGIGGGVPSKVRLGDVVVSTPVDNWPGVVQWDHGKETEGGKFQMTGALNAPPSSLLTALAKLETEHELTGSRIPSFLEELEVKYPRLATKYLKSDSLQDLLFRADYAHVREPFMNTPDPSREMSEPFKKEYEGSEEEYGEPCLFCDKNKIFDKDRKRRSMRVHYGLIASGNQVIKNGILRDRLNGSLGGNVLCFEMEAAGLMNNFPCLVIRGICDYCDSHKNKTWQGYAAAVAAAFAKELLGCIQPSDVKGERPLISEQAVNKSLQRVIDVTVETKKNLDTFLDNEAKRRTDTLDWISSLDFHPFQNDYSTRCQSGTGQEFVESEEVQNWISARKQTMFCQGVPGAGKTFQMAILVNYLMNRFQDDSTVAIGYLYYNFKRQQEQKAEQMLGSLVKQLIQFSSSVPEEVRQLRNRHGLTQISPSLSALSHALTTIIPSFSRVFILIDALDEGEDNERTKLINEMFIVQEKTGLNLFTTSRAINNIATKFKGSISREISPTRHDIFLFLHAHMSELPTFVANDVDLQNEVKASIESAIDGMFLLAQLYMFSLAGKRGPATLRAALKDLQNAASSSDRSSVLDEAYDKSMERIQQLKGDLQRDAVLIISWIVKARRQITLPELQEALAVEIGASELDSDNVPTVEHILQACAALVTVDGDAVELVHYTAQEYFERPNNKWMQNAHASITSICMTYLSFPALQCSPCLSLESLSELVEKHPLYNYAIKYWAYHAAEALTLNLEASKIINFLENGQPRDSWYRNLLYGHSRNLLFSDTILDQLTSLHVAAFFGLHDIVAKLLMEGQSPNAKDSLLRTPIWWASLNGHTRVVEILFEVTTDLETKDKEQGQTPLHAAAMEGHDMIVELLLGQHNMESTDLLGRTPLLLAAQYGSQAVVKLLLEKGACIEAKDTVGQTPLSVAAKFGHDKVVRWLVYKGACIEAEDENYRTPSIVAAQRKDPKSFSDSQEKSDNWILSIPDGSRTLDWVNDEVIEENLIENGAEVEDEGNNNNNNQMSLIVAIKRKQNNLVYRLIEKGANLEARDEKNQTPLILATKKGENTMVKALVEKGANLAAVDKDNHTSLYTAIQAKRKDIIELFIHHGAEVDLHMDNDYTPLTLAIELGDNDIVKLLVEKGAKIDLNDGYDWTPLLIAIERGNKDIVEYLIDKGADLEANGGNPIKTPLTYAVASGKEDIVKLLIQNGAILDAEGDDCGNTALIYATAGRYTDIMQLLIEHGATICATGDGDWTALAWAAGLGYGNAIKLLLANNANLETITRIGHTPLFNAVVCGQLEAVRLLLDHGALLEAEDTCGRTAVACAVIQGHISIIRLLLDRGAKANYRDDRGRTLMHIAVESNRLDIVCVLLGYDAVMADEKDEEGRTPFSQATECGNQDIVEALLNSGKVDADTKNLQGYTPLLYAIGRKYMAILKILLESGEVNVNKKDDREGTPLLHAIRLRDTSIVELLLGSGKVDVNTRDNEGRTPLLFAIELNAMRIVQALLNSANVDVNATDNNGRTPFQFAMRCRSAAIAELLLYTGKVNTNLEDEEGFTPLLYAIKIREISLLRSLLTSGQVNANAADKNGYTPLLHAIRGGDESIIQALLNSKKVDANAADKREYPPLFHALEWGNNSILRLLLESQRVDANTTYKWGYTALHFAVEKGYKNEISLFLNSGKVNANAVDEEGRTPLVHALRRGRISIIQKLLDSSKVDAHIKDKKGRTPLSYAMELGDKSIVKILLDSDRVEVDTKDNKGRTPLSYAATCKVAKALLKKHKVDVNSKDKLNRTPIWYATQAGNHELVELLRRHSAKDGSGGRTKKSSEAKSKRDSIWNRILK